MNLRFYYFASVFLVLAMLMSLIMGFMNVFTNLAAFSPASIKIWQAVFLLMITGATVFELKYFYSKGYDTVFFITFLISVFNIVPMLLYIMGVDMQFGLPPVFRVITHLLLSLTLIKSPAKERFWLKIAGFAMLVYTMFLFVWMFILRLFTHYHEWVFIYQLMRWVDIVSILIPVFFLMNYRSEAKALSNEEQSFVPSWHLVSLALIGLMVTVSFQFKVYRPNPEELVARDQRALSVAPGYEAHTFISKEGLALPYRLLKPYNYDPDKQYPLLIALHGGGFATVDNVTPVQRSWIFKLYERKEIRSNYQAFVFIPNCPPGYSWGGMTFPVESAADLVFETIDDLEKKWPIDGMRRYVFGRSMGGYGALYFAATRPEKLAAVVSMNGGGDPDLAPNAIDVPLWAFHGEKDRAVPVQFSRDFIAAMKEVGGTPKYTEFPGEGHVYSKPLVDVPELLDWIFAQRKE